MTTSFSGGCLCGAIRYECSADPMMPGHCHCLHCQKRSGSGHASAFAVPKAALKVTGEVKYYESEADSGNMAGHGFCPTCGSSVFGRSSGMPDMAVIHAGSLDDSSIFTPSMHIYMDRVQPWDLTDSGLPSFPRMPEMPEMQEA